MSRAASQGGEGGGGPDPLRFGRTKSDLERALQLTIWSCRSKEQTDREAQAHMAIVFLATTEIYCAALAPDSLSHSEPYHPKFK